MIDLAPLVALLPPARVAADPVTDTAFDTFRETFAAAAPPEIRR